MLLTYTRDLAGRITGVSNSAVAGNAENWTYGYNDLGDLILADNLGDNTQDQTWSYDLAGNMLTNSKVGKQDERVTPSSLLKICAIG